MANAWQTFQEELERLDTYTPGMRLSMRDARAVFSRLMNFRLLRTRMPAHVPYFGNSNSFAVDTRSMRFPYMPWTIPERRSAIHERQVIYDLYGEPVRPPLKPNQRKIERCTIRFKYKKVSRNQVEHEVQENEGGKEQKGQVEQQGPIDRCAICFSDFEENEDVRRLPCLHFFHVSCIDEWLQSTQNCPICRIGINTHMDLRSGSRSNRS